MPLLHRESDKPCVAIFSQSHLDSGSVEGENADQREIGGLGLTIVRKNADNMDYKYENNHNFLTIEKIF